MEVRGNTYKAKASWGVGLSNLIAAVVFLGLFFIPFSSFRGVPLLGEYSREPAALFLLAAFALLLLNARLGAGFFVPARNLLFQLVLLLIGWFALSSLLNMPDILTYYFKQTSGVSRLLRQFISLGLSSLVFFLTYYNVFRRMDDRRLFLRVRKVFFYSLVVVTIYAFLETLVIKLRIAPAYLILNLFEYFPFTNVYIDTNLGRISSVTFEPPALATFLFSIAGWMFSYIITHRGPMRYVPGLVVVALAFLSGSRAGLFIILVQLLAFFLMLVKRRRFHALLIKILLAAAGLLLLVGVVKGKEIGQYLIEKTSSITVTEGEHSVSNKSRFGIQYALFEVFKENPIIGVGYGQQTYEALAKYPRWSTKDNWEFRLKYLNEEDKSFPPGYNIYARILAESGIIGLLIFGSLLALILYTCFKLFRWDQANLVCLIAIFVTMIGLYFNWLKTDTFRIFGFWINLAILIKLMKNRRFVSILPKKDETTG